ncbi:MAG: retropepsin-like aspartic protease [Bacteroidales bacterium]|nr:retropepsin-like aspartic protease [Bacteroidales bacterium]
MKFIITIIVLIGLFSCNNANKGEMEQEPKDEKIELPEDAISFSFLQEQIFVNIKVNDSVEGSFIFDTGSNQLYLDSLFVANNNIVVHKTKKKKIRGVGKNTPLVSVSDNVKLEIDTISNIYHNVPITNIRAMGMDVDGVFGTDFFSDLVLKINFDSSYFQIIKPTEFIVPNGYDTLNISLVENKTFIKCEVLIIDSLTVEGWTMLDLGSAHSITFTSVIMDEYDFDGIIKSKVSYTHQNAGYGGASHSWFFRAANLKIGKFTINSPIMNYSTDKRGALSMWGILGLLGTKVMKRFDLIFDFPDKKLYLKPNSLFAEPFSQIQPDTLENQVKQEMIL